MAQLILIMGFLGSGKTTLLENILNDTSERVGVIVNEFGSVSVDGERLKLSNNIDVMEVNSGSIFCACKVDFFIQSVYALMDMGIEKIYVEASGLSNPTSIQKIMSDLNSLNKTKKYISIQSCVSVADAERIEVLLEASVAAVAQIQRADMVLLNKIDNVGKQKKLKAIDAIKKVNPDARIFPCIMCDVDNEIFSKVFNTKSFKIIDPKPISERSFTIRYNKEVSKEKIEAFIDSVIDISVRIKGFLNIDGAMKYIDVVSPYVKIIDCDEDKPCEFILIVYEDKKEDALSIIESKFVEIIGDKPDEILE